MLCKSEKRSIITMAFLSVYMKQCVNVLLSHQTSPLGSVSFGCHSDSGLTDSGGLLHHGKLLYRLSASIGHSAPLRTKRLTNRSTGHQWDLLELSILWALIKGTAHEQRKKKYWLLCVCVIDQSCMFKGFLNVIRL